MSPRTLLLGILLVAVVLLAHLPVPSGEFVYDDITIVKENERIRSFANIPRILTTKYWPEEIKAGLYRPVTLTTFVFDYHLWGLRPWGFRIVNLLLHLLNVALVFLLIRRIGFAAPAAYLGALLFGVHPVHAEAVTAVVGRAELLATTFVLAAFLIFLCYRRSHRIACIAGIGACFLLGLLSKELAVCLPLFLLAWDFLFSREKVRFPITLRWIAPHATVWVLLLLYLPVRIVVIGALGPLDRNTAFYGEPLIDRWGTMLGVLFEYVFIFLFPVNLAADFPYLPGRVPGLDLRAVLGVVVLVGLLYLAFRRRGGLGAAAAIFLLGLAPVSNVVIPTGIVKAARLLYLPSVGLAAMGGWLLWLAWSRPARRPLILAVVLLLGALNAKTATYWLNNEVLWRRTLEISKESVRGLYNLGAILATRGEDDEAEALWIRARSIDEGDTGLPVALGRLYLRQERWEEADASFRAALDLDPPDSRAVDAILGLAEVFLRTDRPREAEEQIREALQIPTGSAAAYFALAMVFAEGGDWARMEEHLRMALVMDPDLPRARVQLGFCLYRTGRPVEALREYEAAEPTLGGPDLADLRVKMGNSLFLIGRREAAAERFREATEIDPASGPAWNNLGGILFAMDRNEEARQAYLRARAILPERTRVTLRLGEIALRLGNKEEARRHLREVIETAGPGEDPLRAQARALLKTVE